MTRRIASLDLPHIVRAEIAHALPRFETFAPTELFVDGRSRMGPAGSPS